MKMDFNLTASIKGDILLLRTEGYINNDGGEKISEEFSVEVMFFDEECGV